MSDPSSPDAAPSVPGAPPNPTAGQVPPTSPAAPPARWKAVAGWCIEWVKKLAPVIWRFFRDAVRYYWGIREPLKEYLLGFTPDLMAESVRQREVRLAPYESHNMAEFGPEGWKLSVPSRCVVCGDPSQNPPTDETRAVDDASRAFWTPLVVMLFGGTIGWILLGRWFAAFSIPMGFVIGYLLRTTMPVRMRLVRCDAHATRTNIPQTLAWGNVLVVRFGHKLVRKIFRYGEMMDTAVPQAVTPPTEELATPPPPETIPLADSPHPDSAVIHYDAGPTYEVEEPAPESKYPIQ